MGKKSNLIHEMKKNLKEETKFGKSKHEEKIKAREQEDYHQIRGIYSTNTFKSYDKSCTHFINFCLEQNHNDIHNLSDCRSYVDDYLRNNEERGLSA